MHKPNYRLESAERDGMKQAKKEEKATRQKERASQQNQRKWINPRHRP
jgi:hypothetical protein